MESPRNRLEYVVISAISFVFVAWSSVFIYRSSFIAIDGARYFCLFDDAMISMRYAWNFSHGYGLVWNPGEYIQGYTNLLMTLLMSFATFIFDKSAAVLFIQISGIAFMLSIAYVTMRIAGHIVQDENHQHQALVRVLSFFFALFYYPLAYWSLMGMETGLLTLLLLSGVLSAFTYTENKTSKSLFSVAVCMGLAFLTRNDSIIFSFLVWSYILWEILEKRTERKDLWLLFAATGIYITFVIGQLTFQYLYYGEILPNTYTLKLSGMPLLERVKNGFGFVRPYLIGTAVILLLPIVNLVVDFRKKKLLLLSILLSSIAYEVYTGGDPWNYWRKMAPAMPLLSILFIIAVNAFALAVLKSFNAYFLRNPIVPGKNLAAYLVILLTLMGLLSANVRFLPEISLVRKPYAALGSQKNVNTAIALSQLTTSDATIGVYWAGALPYFTDNRAIDFLGRSDRHIAKLPPDVSGKVSWYGMTSVPGHNKYDLNYSIKTLKPTYVQGFQYYGQDLSKWGETEYVKVENEYVSLFLLRNSPEVNWDKVIAPRPSCVN